MKLNNRGWGFRAMFFLMSILFCFFLIAIYMIYNYYDKIGNNHPSGYYVEVKKWKKYYMFGLLSQYS